MQAEENYKTCIGEHPNDLRPCETARAAYELDLQMYRATVAGSKGGGSVDVSVNR